MVLLGLVVLLGGCGLLVVAVLPIRMSIEMRATLLAAAGPVIFAGMMMYVEGVAATSRDVPSLILVSAIVLFVAIFVRLALVRRLKANRRDWETKWKHVMPKGLMTELFKRYHDVD